LSSNNKRVWLFVSLVLSLPVTTNLSAQESTKHGHGLEEVVVTARKREESLQDTPVAVSAFSARDLKFRQIESTDRLGEVTPNLTFDPVSPSSGSNAAAQIFIRGVGQTDFTPVTDPGVGLYIDGIYMARTVGNVLDFLDVERVEILRGPQGTLFGRNTIGGAVVIHSKRPTDEFNASLQGQFGDDDMVYIAAKVNGPIVENLAGNLAYAYRNRDGYVERIHAGNRTGDEDSHAIRGSLLWDPTESFSAYATVDYTASRENGAPIVAGGVNDLQAFGTFGNALLASCTVVTINPNFPVSGPPSFPPPGVGVRGAPGCYGRDSFAGEHVSEGTFPVTSELDVWGISLELAWDVNELLSINSTTGYREMEMESARDGDNTPANIFATRDFYDHEQVSQELQFSGPLLEERLQWLLGFYYFQEEGFNVGPVILPAGAIHSGGFYDNDSLAVFFQGTYDVTDRLALTFGVRYTEDTKRFTPDQFAVGDASMAEGSIFGPTWPLLAGVYLSPTGPMLPGDRILPIQEFQEDFDDTSIMVTLAYDWTDQLMTYFTYSQGFKSGGFDQRFAAPPIDPDTGLPTGAPSTFDPETVDSYEIGVKSQWLENRLRLNAAVFYTDYQDLQIIIRETFNPITFNGGTADIAGGEVELTWVPTDRWIITAAVGYIDAEYDELSEAVLTNATPVLPDYKLVNTPEWSSALGVAYILDLRDWATLTPRLDWSYHDDQYNDAVNTIQLFQDEYHLLNLSMALETNDGHWEGILALRNLLDEEYLITGNSAFSTAASYLEQVYARGFEWSISIQYNFF
jgi:iron complex outermembrane receptor protein